MSNISFCNIGNSKGVLKNTTFCHIDDKVTDQLMPCKANYIPWCSTTGNRAASVSFLSSFGNGISFMKTKSGFIIWQNWTNVFFEESREAQTHAIYLGGAEENYVETFLIRKQMYIQHKL